jgi:4-amino-4-deoxy-L-arabinose transferase-like glycosyltransferase
MMFKSHSIGFWVLIAALLFLPFLGSVHLFDWDEINFAEIAREMIVLGNYVEPHMNYALFTEKPPLFFWLQAACMHLIGIGDYAARLPNALLGMLVLPYLFAMGRRMHNARFGFYWALAYCGSILPHLYFKSGIIDPWFNFFIFNGLYFIIRYTWLYKAESPGTTSKRLAYGYIILAALATGLAVLTKGPVAILITALCMGVYWVSIRFKAYIKIIHLLLYALVLMAVVGLWVALNALQHGPTFMLEFTLRQWALLTTPDAGHGGFPAYHPVVLLFGCFPASLFALQALLKNDMHADSRQRDFNRWMSILFWVVLLLFSVVTTKIVHYSSLAYYPLTYLAALSMLRIEQGKWYFTLPLRAGLWAIGALAALLSFSLPFVGMHIHKFYFLFEHDAFTRANLGASVQWHAWQATAGVLMATVLVAALYFYRAKPYRAFTLLFGGTALWVMLSLIFFINNIEQYSQRAAITFWKARAGEDCYVTTYGYKSYAPYYYARVMPQQNVKAHDAEWLLHGAIDKPVYIAAKITACESLQAEVPDAIFLYAKNGFCFYVRKVK